MLGLDNTLSIVISASVAVAYTLFGGLYSVAYTDVIQLICVFFGLVNSFIQFIYLIIDVRLFVQVFCIPFVWTHPAINHEAFSQIDWIGTVPLRSIGSYIDIYLLLILGGVPWQVYFQRVLACRSSKHAQKLSFIAAVGCVLMALPPALLGSLARAAGYSFLSI